MTINSPPSCNRKAKSAGRATRKEFTGKHANKAKGRGQEFGGLSRRFIEKTPKNGVARGMVLTIGPQRDTPWSDENYREENQ